MKTTYTCAAVCGLLFQSSLMADIVIPGADGIDGALNITTDTTIDLGASGTYSADEWAVVFRYTSVNVAAGATLSFTNHPRKAPVVWLVNGDVTIQGTVDLNGDAGGSPPTLASGGPGGFAGGMGRKSGTVLASSGYGPGGGAATYVPYSHYGIGGSYGTKGEEVNAGDGASREPYGNASLVPLIGGCGGGGYNGGDNGIGGGGGGGAILIASTGTVTVDGSLLANGGDSGNNAGGGSGGGIRIVADTIAGGGTVSATGGNANKDGGLGRVRFERVTNSMTNVTNQVIPSPSVIDLLPNDTGLVFPPVDSPTAKILSIGGQAIPDDPSASFGAEPADAKLAETDLDAEGETLVVIETNNVSDNSEVTLVIQPRVSGNGSKSNFTFEATRDAGYVDPTKDRWTVEVPVSIGYAALQIRVNRQ